MVTVTIRSFTVVFDVLRFYIMCEANRFYSENNNFFFLTTLFLIKKVLRYLEIITFRWQMMHR